MLPGDRRPSAAFDRSRSVTMRVARTAFAAGVMLGAAGLMGVPPSPQAAAQSACAPTKPDMLGPFYVANAPARERTGQGLVVTGVVRSAAACAPIPGARIEWWSVNPRGEYDDAHRATETAGSEGRYRYETDPPTAYPGRPPHLHVRVSAPGHRVLVTQLYPKSSQTSIETDFVLARE
jgi:protocatechuate 3,4-dioxygenase beta subunit